MFVKTTVLATTLALVATSLAASIQVGQTNSNVQCRAGPLQCCYTLQDDQIASLGKMVSSVQAHFLPIMATNTSTGLESLASSFAFICKAAGPDGYCFPGTQPRCCDFDGYGIAAVGCWAPSNSKA